jgi:putative flippase GtrA
MIKLLPRYIIVGLIGYVFLSIGSILLTVIFSLNTVTAYGASLLFLYFIDYILNIKFVFNSAYKKSHLVLYPTYLLISWFLGIWLFRLFEVINNDIWLTNALTMVTLFPIRFFLNYLFLKKF